MRPPGRCPGGGADAGRAFVSVSLSSASVRSPVSGAGVQHHACLSERPLSSVRYGRLSVQMSGVRCGCPVSVGSRVGCVRPGDGGGWRWGRQPHGWDGRVGMVARRVHGQFVVCPSRSLAIEAGAGRAGPTEASAWAWPSSWEVVGQWPGRPRGRPGQGRICAGIARWWRARVRSEVATTLRGHRVRPRAESPGRCEPPGLDCDLRVRPWCGRSVQ